VKSHLRMQEVCDEICMNDLNNWCKDHLSVYNLPVAEYTMKVDVEIRQDGKKVKIIYTSVERENPNVNKNGPNQCQL
jgi:hypothetical protein